TDASHYITPTSGTGSAVLFREVMTEALRNQPNQSFKVTHISTLIEKKKKEEESKRGLKERFNNELQKWEDKWNKHKEKKPKNKEKGKGH
ncbi:MAG TPA: penicillin-binding protein, partial [Pseudoneobacillus sp.]|nr:penicillin-binding protein [Pseudoneobacillus sp.]